MLDLAVDELRIEPQGPFDARQPSSKHSAQSNRPAFGCKDTQDDTCGLWRPRSENRETFPCVFAELGWRYHLIRQYASHTLADGLI